MSRLLLSTLIAIAAAFALTACSGTPKDTHPGQPVTKRKAVFKHMLRALEPMGMVARDRKEYDRQEFLASAQELKHLVTQPWIYFTPDSDYPPTRAKADVWQKPAEFKQAQEKLQTAADQLAKAAESGNLDIIRPAVKEVQKSCKACHDQFRSGAA
ncbi:MAG: cytochrome c [Sulfuricella sp.]|jgi:cytochrome c556|nr:cytochrome c [Sulfuricella sp.]